MLLRKLFFEILVLLYFFFVGYSTLYLFQRNQFSDDHTLLKNLQQILNISTSLDITLNKTSNLFNEHLHLVAMIFTTKKVHKVFHTSIEQDKFPKIDMKLLIEDIQNNKDISNFSKIKILQHKNPLTPFNVYLVVIKQLTLKEFIIFAYYYTYKLKYIIIIVLISSVLLIFISILYLMSNIYLHPSTKKRHKLTVDPLLSFGKNNQTVDLYEIELQNSEKTRSITKLSFDGFRLHYVISILDYIAKTLVAKKVTCYKFINDQTFQPLYQRYENIYIQYKNIVSDNKFNFLITNLENFQVISFFQYANVMIIPLSYKANELFGLIVVENIQNTILKHELRNYFEKIKKRVREFSKNIYIYNQYEDATIEPDSKFFTYPFFFFTLRERLLNNRIIPILLFEFINQKKYPKEKILNWYQEIWSIIESKDSKLSAKKLHPQNLEYFQQRIPANLPYRLEENLFAIIFHVDLEEEKIFEDTLKQSAIFLTSKFKQKVDAIQNILKQTVGHAAILEGGVIINPIGNTSLEVLMKHIEHHMTSIKKKETYGSIV